MATAGVPIGDQSVMEAESAALFDAVAALINLLVGGSPEVEQSTSKVSGPTDFYLQRCVAICVVCGGCETQHEHSP